MTILSIEGELWTRYVNLDQVTEGVFYQGSETVPARLTLSMAVPARYDDEIQGPAQVRYSGETAELVDQALRRHCERVVVESG